jgi:hypothetical protein
MMESGEELTEHGLLKHDAEGKIGMEMGKVDCG